MNKLISSLSLTSILFIFGCTVAPKTTGPVTISNSLSSYHKTLTFPDGHQSEFHFKEIAPSSLNEEGAVVDITYTGDLDNKDEDNNHVLSVKIIKHGNDYIRHHPELWTERKYHILAKSSGDMMEDYFAMDDTNQVCATITEYPNSLPTVIVNYSLSRVDGVSGTYLNLEGAVKAVDKACK